MAKKVTVISVRVRGESFWQVGWHDPAGKRKRKFFPGKAAADAFAADKRGSALDINRKLAIVPTDDRERMLFAWNEAKRRGVDLLSLLSNPQSTTTTSTALGTAIIEMLEVKEKAGRASKYRKNLRLDLKSFATGRESLPVDKITLQDVEIWLDSKKQASRSTYRSRLSTFFKFAIRRGWRSDNPCDRLEVVRLTKQPPYIFTIDQIKTALKWCREDFKGEQKCASKGGQIYWARTARRMTGFSWGLGWWARKVILPLGCWQWMILVPAGRAIRKRSTPAGTRPSGPTVMGVRTLQT